MAKPLTRVEGAEKVLRNLNREIKGVKGRTKGGLLKAALFVRGDAQRRVPIVTGHLKNSAFVSARDTLFGPGAVVGFSAKYALSVHENPRAGKTGGVSPSGKKYTTGTTTAGNESKRIIYSVVGGWKFLEKAYTQNVKKIISIIASKAKVRK